MNITIKDFKPFKGKSPVKLKPVTIFIGKNNAGKTSLTDFINLQINSRNIRTKERFLDILKSPSISQLVNFHKWKYLPEDITNLLSGFNKKTIDKIVNNPGLSEVQLRTVQQFIKNEEKYYNDKRDIKIATLEFQISNIGSKNKAKKLTDQKSYLIGKVKESQKEREQLFSAFQKLCSYDPNIFYEFINSSQFLEQKMLHSMAIQMSGSQISIPTNLIAVRLMNEMNNTGIKHNLDTDIRRIKYLKYQDKLRLHTIIDSLKPYYSTGLELSYELSTDNGMNFSRAEQFKSISIEEFNSFVESIYYGKKVSELKKISELNDLDAKMVALKKKKRTVEELVEVDQLTEKHPFKNSFYHRKYAVGKRGFFDDVFKIFNSRDKMFENNLSLPVEMAVNINDNETNHFFNSKNRLFDGLRIDATNSKRTPACMYFEYDTDMYKMNKDFVKKLLKKCVPHFYEMCSKDLEAIFHSHNKYYYKNPHERFFKTPGHSVYREIERNQFEYANWNRKNLKNPLHASKDNLPYKCTEIVKNPKITERFPFSSLPKIAPDKFINGIFIQHHSGHQNFHEDLIKGVRVHVHERVLNYKNDVDCIESFNKKDPSKFLDNIFEYDSNNNKVFFKSRQNNPFSTPDFESVQNSDYPASSSQSKTIREHNIMNLISVLVDMYEAESEFISSKFSTKRYANRTKKSINFLKQRERFAIGAALSSSVSKIFEILYEDYIEEYCINIMGSGNFVSRDGYGRRVQRQLSSSIIDSSNLPSAGKNQYLSLEELNLMFGKDFEAVVSSKNILTRLLARVNNALKTIDLPYAIRIDVNEPSIRKRIVGDKLYVISLDELNENNEILHISDFSMVGEGTRSIVTLLMQIELQRLTKGAMPCFLTIREFENHLHPSLVGRFFKFLIDRTRGTNINIIIETHSEIILRTLQTVVKASTDSIDEESLDADKVAIYYVEKVDSGNSEIRELVLDKSGYFDDEKGSKLPPDFFDINSKLSKELLKD